MTDASFPLHAVHHADAMQVITAYSTAVTAALPCHALPRHASIRGCSTV